MNNVNDLIAQHSNSVALSFSRFGYPTMPVTAQTVQDMVITYGDEYVNELRNLINAEPGGPYVYLFGSRKRKKQMKAMEEQISQLNANNEALATLMLNQQQHTDFGMIKDPNNPMQFAYPSGYDPNVGVQTPGIIPGGNIPLAVNPAQDIAVTSTVTSGSGNGGMLQTEPTPVTTLQTASPATSSVPVLTGGGGGGGYDDDEYLPASTGAGSGAAAGQAEEKPFYEKHMTLIIIVIILILLAMMLRRPAAPVILK